MFVLRRVHPKQPVYNQVIGKSYLTILDWRDKEDFERISLNHYPTKKDMPDSIYGFISFDDGKDIIPLYKRSYYYIMTSEGATFEKIEYRDDPKD